MTGQHKSTRVTSYRANLVRYIMYKERVRHRRRRRRVLVHNISLPPPACLFLWTSQDKKLDLCVNSQVSSFSCYHRVAADIPAYNFSSSSSSHCRAFIFSLLTLLFIKIRPTPQPPPVDANLHVPSKHQNQNVSRISQKISSRSPIPCVEVVCPPSPPSSPSCNFPFQMSPLLFISYFSHILLYRRRLLHLPKGHQKTTATHRSNFLLNSRRRPFFLFHYRWTLTTSGRLHIAHTTVAADPSAADIEFEFQISYHLIPWILFLAGLHIIWDFASFSLFFFLGFTAREILDCLWPKSGPSYADDIVSQSRVHLQMRGTSAAGHK